MLNIYKASAGSGKTFALTREYLSLLLGYRDPETGRWHLNSRPRQAHRHILAITFTNKATDEMTARIISQLAILGRRDPSEKSESKYMKELCRRFDTDPDTLAALASDTLDDTLFDFAYFHVSTIDAFFQTVLRTFTREVELPDDYGVEIDNRYTLALGVAEMFRSLNYRASGDPVGRERNKWLTQWLGKFMRGEIDAGRSVNIFSRRGGMQSRIVSMLNAMFDETFKLNVGRISAYLEDLNRLTAFARAIESQLPRLAKEVRESAAGLLEFAGDYADDFSVTNALKPFRALADGSKTADGVSDTFMSRRTDHRPMFKKSYNPPADVAAGIDDRIDSLLDLCAVYRDKLKVISKLRDGIVYLGLLGCTLYFVNALCKENNLIMLSDTGSILRDIITDDETPFVYERLGYYLNNFLIDEFQDTSRMQWEILRPMLMESLSRNEHDLIIGDEKQSIYRFRNSDPELLGHQVADKIDDTFGPGLTDITGLNISENNNWRSSYEVIRFNNSLFRLLGHEIDADEIYESVIQRVSPLRTDAPRGHVVVQLVDEGTPAPETDDGEHEGVIGFGVLTSIRAHIDRLLQSGWKYRDIALLVRTHAEGQQVINYLLGLNSDPTWIHPDIEIASTDALEISSSPAVRLIIDMLRLSVTRSHKEVEHTDSVTGEKSIRLVENEAHKLTMLTRWYQYFINLGTDPRTGQPTGRGGALANAVIMLADATTLDERDLKWRDSLNKALAGNIDVGEAANGDDIMHASTLNLVVDRIIDRFITPETLQNETVYIAAFMDLVIEFMATSGNDVRSFVEWWDRAGRYQTLSSLPEANAVSVMTIHQSKGLEFPCVILPNADWTMVTYSSAWRSAYGWYPLEPRYFEGIPAELIPPMMPLRQTADLAGIPMFGPTAREYARTQRVDALNLAYVAFTRASHELIAFVPVNADKPDDNRLGSLIDIALSGKDLPGYAGGGSPAELTDEAAGWVVDLGEYFDPATMRFEYGEPTVAPLSESAEKSVDNIFGTEMTMKHPGEVLEPYYAGTNTRHTTFTDSDCLPLDYDKPVDRGVIIHSILSRIKSIDRLDIIIRRTAYRLHLTAGQTDELSAMLHRALSDPRVKQWFAGYRRVANERSIAGKMLRRPDRIVWTADGHVDVIDYKTGGHNPRYHDQVRVYVDRLRRSGERHVRGWLWYVAEGEIVRVDTSVEAVEDMYRRFAVHSQNKNRQSDN